MPQKRAEQVKNQSADEFGLDQNVVWYLRPFFQFLYQQYFRVNTKGINNIPNKKGIIVANHAGSLPYDGAMVNLAVLNEHRRKNGVRFLVHDFVFTLPYLSNLIEKIGGVRASPYNAMRLLKKDELILVFPEGIKGIGKTYEHRYKLQKFGKGGFIRTAIKSKAPVIPTAIIGSEEIHPIIWSSKELGKKLNVPFVPITPTFPWLGPLGLVPLPSKWKIVFGKPIKFDKYKPLDADNDELVMKLSERVRKTIQQMINTNLAKRKSIWQ